MEAKYGNIVATERNRLEDVIPLSTPFSICIDPSNVCNFKCQFCAVQYSDEPVSFKKQIMDYDFFCKIIDDISAFGQKLKVLRLNGQGEPLVNPRFPDMIAYAKKKKVAERIETITNGSLLNPELNQKIVDSGIDRIRISIESINSEGYSKLVGKKIDFDKLIDNIRDLHDKSGNCEIYCKIVDVAVPSEEDKQRFAEIMGSVCDRFFIDKVIPLWSDFDRINDVMSDSESGIHGQKIKKIEICPYPFYSLIVNPDGEVTVCCADWKRKLIVGDLKKESMVDIWNGSKLRSFWKDLAAKKKNDYEMCRKCLLPSFDCNDDIDDFGEMILNKLNF